MRPERHGRPRPAQRFPLVPLEARDLPAPLGAPEAAPLAPVPLVPPDTKKAEQENREQYARAKNTARSYASAWETFTQWCRCTRHVPLPASPEAVSEYIAWLAQGPLEGLALFENVAGSGETFARLEEVAKSRPKKINTINTHLSAITSYHTREGLFSPRWAPRVQDQLRAAAVKLGSRPNRKSPLLTKQLRRTLDHLGHDVDGCMRRALLLIGWRGAMRRSELVGIDVEHVTFDDDVVGAEAGVKILIPRSKVDQLGVGRTIGITYANDKTVCPVRALKRWLRVSGLTSGPLFRRVLADGSLANERLSVKQVNKTIKRLCALEGLDPKRFAGHSLRAGFATSLWKAGGSLPDIARQTGHKSLDTLAIYLREEDPLRDNPGKDLL